MSSYRCMGCGCVFSPTGPMVGLLCSTCTNPKVTRLPAKPDPKGKP